MKAASQSGSSRWLQSALALQINSRDGHILKTAPTFARFSRLIPAMQFALRACRAICLLWSFAWLPALTSSAQQAPVDSLLTVPMFVASGGVDLPAASYASRFGLGYEAGAGFWVKTRRGWLFGVEYSYLFTSKVREAVLDSIRLRSVSTPNQLVGKDGLFADVRVTGRGYKFPTLKIGRVWSGVQLLPGASVNGGAFALLGVGFWQHKINFEDVAGTATPLSGAYVKGYDRLTNGLALTQNLGYLYLSRRRRVNCFLALELTEGFTRNRRAWDFSTAQRDTRARFDVLIGARVGWLFTVYKKLPRSYYYD